MGILDEAIREHLDLKRRQGAAEDELQRLEDEAFGPPSRPGDPDFPESTEMAAAPATEESEAAAEAAPEPPAAQREAEPANGEQSEAGLFDHEEQPSEELDLDLDEESTGDAPDLGTEEALDREAHISSLDTVEHHFEDAIDEAEVVEDEPPPPSGEAPPTEDHPATVEGPEPEEPALADEDGEDVLEETPEFLQDAPEDDELWFEQGEPKDFDF